MKDIIMLFVMFDFSEKVMIEVLLFIVLRIFLVMYLVLIVKIFMFFICFSVL